MCVYVNVSDKYMMFFLREILGQILNKVCRRREMNEIHFIEVRN